MILARSLTVASAIVALAVAAPAAGIAAAGAAVATLANSAPRFYWSSYDASRLIENSKWATSHGLANAACSGVGSYKKDTIGRWAFATFRCALKNKDYALVAHATLATTGPETFRITAYEQVRPICGPA